MPQGTVKSFDAATRSGTLLLDSLEEMSFDAESLKGSELLKLARGQRVRFEVEEAAGEKRVTTLRIITL
ncbi:MAG: hypothetical protein WDA71_12415 [Actinomycetota bacterium]